MFDLLFLERSEAVKNGANGSGVLAETNIEVDVVHSTFDLADQKIDTATRNHQVFRALHFAFRLRMAWEADCQNVHFGLVPLWRMNYKTCSEIPIQSQV